MQVIFLDFDGVLHPYGEQAVDEDFRLIGNPNLFVWLPIIDSLLAPYPAVRIVVSSDWRRLFDDKVLIRLLGPLGSRFEGVVETYRSSRADEIMAEAHRRRLTQWLAIDDHPSVVSASRKDERYIACEPETGIAAAGPQSKLRFKLTRLARGDS
ncbi:HAD domain-containing protein [Cupriavidus basilensis]|uniref:HAD domain-containing protein n=1 Tax=Cupriavidus basilensis TaxID=68895 RepID=UPI0039F701DC